MRGVMSRVIRERALIGLSKFVTKGASVLVTAHLREDQAGVTAILDVAGDRWLTGQRFSKTYVPFLAFLMFRVDS